MMDRSGENEQDIVVANKGNDDNSTVIEVGSPEHMLPKQNDIELRPNGDLILSNPDLPTEAVVKDNKVRLTWDNLSVDAVLPPPSCFSRFKSTVCGGENNIVGRPTKPILRNVSGVAEPGTLLAIMGASGAGKTTLLNVLSSQNRQRLKISGSIRVNDQNIKRKIKNISAYVQQEDVFIGTLTVQEHLTFQALLRMDDSYTKEQKKKRVNDVMAELSLLKCKDTIIGVPGRIRGISGGENKRLSFASEIITNPNLLFVDEPTSGLDSFMAESVIRALQEIVKEGKTVLATIHQPSSEVFQLFDKLLLMSEGRTAFLGDRKDAISFFSSVGFPCPMNYNPADHYIHTLAIMPANQEECKEKSKRICDTFEAQFAGGKASSFSQSEEVEYETEPIAIKFKMPFFEQLRTVLWRSSKSNIREPFVAKLRVIQAVFMSVIAGLVYLRQDNDQDSIYNLNGAMFFAITTMSFNTITSSLFVFPAELPVFLKEHKLGMYRTSVYFVSKTAAELPWYIGSTFLFCVIIYFMTGLREDATSFFIFMAIMQLVAQCSLSLGYFVSALSPTVQVATSVGPIAMLPLLLFGGFFVKDESIPPYFIPFKYISWFKYSFEALQINQWKDFAPINCGNVKVCISDGNTVIANNGYDPDNLGLDIGVMAALTVAFRFLAFIVVLIRASRTK